MNRKKKLGRPQPVEPYLYLLPTILLFLFILAVPLFDLVKYSLGDSNIIQGYKGWNNFENFTYLTSSKFLKSVGVTLVYVFFGVIGVIGCGTAVSLNTSHVVGQLSRTDWTVPSLELDNCVGEIGHP